MKSFLFANVPLSVGHFMRFVRERFGGMRTLRCRAVLLACCFAAIIAVGGGVSCKYCGAEAREARALLSALCPKHPFGFAIGWWMRPVAGIQSDINLVDVIVDSIS